MPAREAWGLDIGQNGIHAVKIFRNSPDSAEISDIFFRPLDTQVDDPDYDDKVTEALEEFVDEKNVGSTPVVVSLPGYATLFRDFPLPAVADSQMAEIVSYEAKQLIPYPLDEVLWDYHKIREDDDSGEVGIALVCCRKDIVGHLLEMLDDVGINVEALQVGPVALVNYIMYDTPPDGPALILDAGARGTDFIILNDGAFWLRSIGISGSELSRTLMSKFSIPFEEAEKLKCTMGESKQADRVFKVVEPTIRNFCGEVQRSVGFYKSLFRGVELSEVICVGNTFLLPGMDQCVADNMAIPTRTLALPEEIDLARGVDEEEIEENAQIFGTAAGLALQGIGFTEINMTLLPEERRFAKLIHAKIKYGVAAVALIALAVILNFTSSKSRKSEFDVDLQKMDSNIAIASQQKKKYEQNLADLILPEERNKALAGYGKQRAWLRDARAQVNQVIDSINDTRFRKTNSSKDLSWASAVQKMKRAKELEYNTELAKEPEQKEARLSLIEAQIKRRIDWYARRPGRIVLNNSEYLVVKMRKTVEEEGADATYDLIARPDVGFTAVTIMDTTADRVDDDEDEAAIASTEEIEEFAAVEVILTGYVVSTNGKDVLDIKKKLSKLKQVIKISYEREIEGKVSSLMLPKISLPPVTKKKNNILDTDNQVNVGVEVEKNKLEFEKSNEEKIIEFKMTFYYRPQAFKSKVVFTPAKKPAKTDG